MVRDLIGDGYVQIIEESIEDALQIEEIKGRRLAGGPRKRVTAAGQHNRQLDELIGQRSILAGQEDLADFKEGDAVGVAAVGGRRFEGR